MGWRARQTCGPSQDEAVGCLRAASGSVRTAINELGALAMEDGSDLLMEAREQLLAALHLIDGAGVALRRNGL
jgi:hypothetical protein